MQQNRHYIYYSYLLEIWVLYPKDARQKEAGYSLKRNTKIHSIQFLFWPPDLYRIEANFWGICGHDWHRYSVNSILFVFVPSDCFYKANQIATITQKAKISVNYKKGKSLVSWDVVAMFPNIDKDLGLLAARQASNSRPLQFTSTECLVKQLQFSLNIIILAFVSFFWSRSDERVLKIDA